MKNVKSLNITQAKKILSHSFNLPLQMNIIYGGGLSIYIDGAVANSKQKIEWGLITKQYILCIEGEWKFFKNDKLLFEWPDFNDERIKLFFDKMQSTIKIKDVIFSKMENKTIFLFNNNIKIIVPFSKNPGDDDWFFLFNNRTKTLSFSNGSIKIQKQKALTLISKG